MKRIILNGLLMGIVLCISNFAAIAQGPEDGNNLPAYQKVLPASPTAASLGRYGEYKVSNSTGVPGIAIPLLEVRGNTMSVPISLSYHGGGNKVEDVASWVGMGWSLNAGGVISRTVIGNEDGAGNGLNAFYSQGFDPDNFDPKTVQEDFNLFRALTKQGWTADPDVYSFNIMGLSGQFILDTAGVVHLYSKQELEIAYVAGLGEIDRFIVTTGNGTVYELAEKEITYSASSSNCSVTESANTFTSAWYLTEIYNEYEQFSFTYLDESILRSLNRHQSQSIGIQGNTNCGGGFSECFGQSILDIDKKKLSTITGPFGTATFISNKTRLDLSGATALESISYQDITVDLTTSFVTSTKPGEGPTRMYLNSVSVSAGDESPMDYTFDYDDTVLPPRDSYSIDHYGYFNGKTNLIPMPHGQHFSDGADRDVVPNKARAGVLEEITYPTGGKTSFTWESNQQSLGIIQPRVNTSVVISDDVTSFNESYAKPFTIEEAQSVNFTYSVGNTNVGEQGEVSFLIYNVTTQAAIYTNNLAGNGTITNIGGLPVGDYEIRAENLGPSFNGLSLRIDYYTLGSPVETIEYLGGLRIKEIINKNIDNAELFRKTYVYGDLSVSNKVIDEDYFQTRGTYSGTSNIVCWSSTRSSTSRFALSNSVSYEEVFEYNGSLIDNAGYTRYVYHDDQDNGGGIIGTPKVNQSWKRALVKDIYIYNSDDYLRRHIRNEYEFVRKFSYAGVKAEYELDHPQVAGLPRDGLDKIRWRIYDYHSEFGKLLYTEVEESYGEGDGEEELGIQSTSSTPGSGSTTRGDLNMSISYEYFREDEHIKPGKVTTSDSEGNIWVEVKLYPRDFSNEDVVFTNLKNRYSSMPIEQVKYFETPDPDGVRQVVTGQSNEYDINGDLESSYRLETANPIAAANFTFANGSTDPSLLGLYSRSSQFALNPEVEISYYEDGKIKEVKDRSLTTTYLWGYDGRYPVAKVANIAYSDLETLMTVSVINQLRSSNSDSFIRQTLNNLRDNLTVRQQLEISLYKVGVGVSEMIDPNGYKSTYEYDEFNRLYKEKDDDGNTIKEYKYTY